MPRADEYRKYRIRQLKTETVDTRTLVFDDYVEARPGQFMMAWLPGVSANPLSIAGDKPLKLTVKKVGDEKSFTSRIHGLMPGDSLFLTEPRGNSFMDFAKKELRHYLVAGGCGAIPLAYLAEMLSDSYVLLGARTWNEVLFEREFTERAKYDPLISTDDGSYCTGRFVTDLLSRIPTEDSQFFVCGPRGMMKRTGEILMSRGVDPDEIIVSTEPYMKCGTGHCGSCEIDGYRACVDGPVFSLSEIGTGLNYKRTKSGRLEL